MKVRVAFTLDVDVEQWRTAFGQESAAEVREDVLLYTKDIITAHLLGQELLVDTST